MAGESLGDILYGSPAQQSNMPGETNPHGQGFDNTPLHQKAREMMGDRGRIDPTRVLFEDDPVGAEADRRRAQGLGAFRQPQQAAQPSVPAQPAQHQGDGQGQPPAAQETPESAFGAYSTEPPVYSTGYTPEAVPVESLNGMALPAGINPADPAVMEGLGVFKQVAAKHGMTPTQAHAVLEFFVDLDRAQAGRQG